MTLNQKKKKKRIQSRTDIGNLAMVITPYLVITENEFLFIPHFAESDNSTKDLIGIGENNLGRP